MPEPTCVVGRVVAGVEELLDKQGSGNQGMLGNGVQKKELFAAEAAFIVANRGKLTIKLLFRMSKSL
ncbi:hypothetical protein GOODEAATRI_030011 [Goodea atripinnis]|uniref:Uncharacterized protein n=1 Tax=Goodea atripinnis TaxID=208336 RepID=A0ABV0MLW3_9TELE